MAQSEVVGLRALRRGFLYIIIASFIMDAGARVLSPTLASASSGGCNIDECYDCW
ncbi:MAG: hypothetical protein TU36_005410 [Vulcanisaeta sp. AZ3]